MASRAVSPASAALSTSLLSSSIPWLSFSMWLAVAVASVSVDRASSTRSMCSRGFSRFGSPCVLAILPFWQSLHFPVLIRRDAEGSPVENRCRQSKM